MSNLTGNKIFAGVVLSLIVLKVGQMASHKVVEADTPEKKSYIIDTSAIQTSNGGEEEKEEDAPDIKPFLLKGNVENGEKVFKKCMQCHTINKGGAHRTGPNLWNIVLTPYGHASDFSYSKALKELSNKWTYDNLNHFLFKPRKHIQGT